MKFAALFLMVAFASITTHAQEKAPGKSMVYPKAEQLQAIVVTTKNWNAVQGRGQMFERQTGESPWVAVGSGFPVVVGAHGMAWGSALNEVPADTGGVSMKIEGDGKAPAGIFMLTSAFGAAEQKIKLPFVKLLDSTECVDDVKSSQYNRIVDKFQVATQDWNSSEKMRAVGKEYELGIFVAHNAERAKGAGSCIFLHRWTDEKTGTSGCTAMSLEQMEKIFRWIDRTKNPVLIQLPEAAYQQFQSAWKLPAHLN
jgi:D-alanyl-D-alanine dipeptidase